VYDGPANGSAARPAARAPPLPPAQSGGNRLGSAGRSARGGDARVGTEEWAGRGRARRADWLELRSEAVNGGWAGPLLQNKGQAAHGAVAGGCLAPGLGASNRSASRASPRPPESRARADRGLVRMGAAGRGADRRAAVSTGGPPYGCACGYFVAS
jgi:hypothetical protein